MWVLFTESKEQVQKELQKNNNHIGETKMS